MPLNSAEAESNLYVHIEKTQKVSARYPPDSSQEIEPSILLQRSWFRAHWNW